MSKVWDAVDQEYLVVAVEGTPEKRIEAACHIIMRYGCIDGGHHKQWVLTQAVKILLGPEKYKEWELESQGEWNEEEEEYEYGEWDEGIPP